jgi:hypothetical protein
VALGLAFADNRAAFRLLPTGLADPFTLIRGRDDISVVAGHRVLNVVDVDVVPVASLAVALGGATEVLVVDAGPAAMASVHQPASTEAVDRALEIVLMLAVALAGMPPGAEDILDPVEQSWSMSCSWRPGRLTPSSVTMPT